MIEGENGTTVGETGPENQELTPVPTSTLWRSGSDPRTPILASSHALHQQAGQKAASDTVPIPKFIACIRGGVHKRVIARGILTPLQFTVARNLTAKLDAAASVPMLAVSVLPDTVAPPGALLVGQVVPEVIVPA